MCRSAARSGGGMKNSTFRSRSSRKYLLDGRPVGRPFANVMEADDAPVIDQHVTAALGDVSR